MNVKGVLASFGLKPRMIPITLTQAVGIGGPCRLEFAAETPFGIGGICGVLTIHGVDADIPLVIPVDLCIKLGMIMDTPRRFVHWQYLGKTSILYEVGKREASGS